MAFRIEIVPIVIGCLGRGRKKVEGETRKVLNDNKTITAEAQEMLRTVLCEIGTMMRKELIEGE